MASPERCLQILAGVKAQSDRFLEPARLFGAARQSPSPPAKRARACGDDPEGEPRGEAAALRVKQLDLVSELAELRAALEEAKEEAHQQRRRAELQKGREAGSVARLEQRCEQLEIERRAELDRAGAAERRLHEAEDEQQQLQTDQAALQLTIEQQKAQILRLEQAPSLPQEAPAAAPQERRGAAQEEPVAAAREAGLQEEAQALRSRIGELEGEAQALRVALREGAPDRELSAQLQAQHATYALQLKDAAKTRRELDETRQQVVRFEQEHSSLQAALVARTAALEEAQSAVLAAAPLKHNVEAYAKAAKAIVAGARGPKAEATPFALSHAWTTLETELAAMRRSAAEAAQALEAVQHREREVQLELGRAQHQQAKAVEETEALRLEVRRERDEAAAQRARTQALREAMTKQHRQVGAGEASAVAASASQAEVKLLTAQLEASNAQVHQQGQLLEQRGRDLEQLRRDWEAAQKGQARIAEAEAKARRVDRLNKELWDTQRELEHQQERLLGELEASEARPQQHRGLEAEAGDHPAATASASGGEAAALRAKKAMRKHVQDFREGLFGLLGWKVDMKGEEGGAVRWHLASRYHSGGEGDELVFQLRPAEPGRQAQFDLLGTAWAERLLEDRHAMAYLQAYGSIPGFLAAVTTDLLAQQEQPQPEQQQQPQQQQQAA